MTENKAKFKLRKAIEAKFASLIGEATDAKTIKELKNTEEHQSKFLAAALFHTFHEKYLCKIQERATKADLLAILADVEQRIRSRNIEKMGSNKLSPRDLDHLRQKVDALNLLFGDDENRKIYYKETALYEQHEVICPVCGKQMVLEEGTRYGNRYVCPSGDDVIVSCHPHTTLPSAVPATTRLRQMRQFLHGLTANVFKGSRTNMYRFIEAMLGRPFDDFQGHIGSMTEDECQRIINLFRFLQMRLNELKESSSEDVLLEKNLLSHATIDELRAYFVLVRANFSTLALAKTYGAKTYQDFCNIIIPLIRKGLPLNKWKIPQAKMTQDLVEAIAARTALAAELMSIASDRKKLSRVVFF